MTQHYPKPIAPPPELVQQWASEWMHLQSVNRDNFMAARAAQWGADQELEACCHCFARDLRESLALELRARRRPKPLTLKEQALAALEHLDDATASQMDTTEAVQIIGLALEQLDD